MDQIVIHMSDINNFLASGAADPPGTGQQVVNRQYMIVSSCVRKSKNYMHVLFSLLSRGSIFNNSLSGLIKHPKESPRRGRLC